ncbi:MAG: GerMN domain-containing protein [Acidimicrobiia bacterium]
MSVFNRGLVMVLAFALTGCSSTVATTTTQPPPTTEPATTSTTAVPAAQVVVYLMMDTTGTVNRPGPFLIPVVREAVRDDLESTLAALFAGPTADETQMVPAMSSAIPEGTQLLGTDVAGGVATVDVSEDFASGGGSFSMMARLAQVVYTATRFDGVDSVLFELDGAPVTTFSGEGIVLNGPQTRDGYLDFLPMIFVDDPAYGGVLGNPAHLTGVAAVFEATFQAVVTDADGVIIAQPPYLMTSEGQGWGTFDETIDYDVGQPQWGSLIVWEDSAKDGSQINVREYRVWLTPAP